MKHIRQTKFESLKNLVEWQDFDQRNITGLDDRGEETTWRKNLFRRSDEWKWFCKQLKEKRGNVCERCGKSGVLAIHHLVPTEYDNLNEDNFAILCDSCHLFIESYCSTEERMKMCPNVDKKFLIKTPYKQPEKIVMNKTYDYLKRKWSISIKEKKKPGTYINAESISDKKIKECKEAALWLLNNKDKL